MNILLSGATGYLGSNIARCLSEEGHRIICAVRKMPDGFGAGGCQMVSCEPGQMDLLFKQTRIDWVINGAAAYNLNDTLYWDLFESNVAFPFRVLNMAVKYGVKNFMAMGTSLPEELNAYSFTKAKFSEFGKYISRKEKINFADLRLEMFYGGINEPDTRFIKSSIMKLLKGEPLYLTAGTQKRDMVRVEDILSLVRVLVSSSYVDGYRILPVGTGESYPVKEAIQYMAECCSSKSELHFGTVEGRIGEPDTVADVAWYRDVPFEPVYSFYGGIRDACKSYRQQLEQGG